MPATYRIVLTSEARANIRGIGAYIRKHSPENAKALVDTLLGAIDSLKAMPMRFRQVGTSKKRKTPVHATVVHPFIVYYSVGQQARTVHILQVLHGRQRQPKRFP